VEEECFFLTEVISLSCPTPEGWWRGNPTVGPYPKVWTRGLKWKK